MALSGTTGGSIKVEGLRETLKQLEALGATKDEFVAINVEAARTVADAAQSKVPVYDGTRNSKTGKRYYYKSGGDLRASLRVSKAKGYAAVVMGNRKVQYANPIHWGWLYDKENFINKNIKPNPFLKRALDDNYQKVIRQYDKRIQALLDKYGVGN